MVLPPAEPAESADESAESARAQLTSLFHLWIEEISSYLSWAAVALYLAGAGVGVYFQLFGFDDPRNYVAQVFAAGRICTYLYLVYSVRESIRDFEPSHPGLHLPSHFVNAIVAVTFYFGSAHGWATGLCRYLVFAAIADAALLAFTAWRLRKCQQVVARWREAGRIDELHPLVLKKLCFIPEINSVSARKLLWDDVHYYDDDTAKLVTNLAPRNAFGAEIDQGVPRRRILM